MKAQRLRPTCQGGRTAVTDRTLLAVHHDNPNTSDLGDGVLQIKPYFSVDNTYPKPYARGDGDALA